MDFEVFKEIMTAIKRIDTIINGLEDVLQTQFTDGLLLETQVGLLDCLVDKYEPCGESIIYQYCFEHNFGETACAYYCNNKEYLVDDYKTLYEYLVEKSKTTEVY